MLPGADDPDSIAGLREDYQKATRCPMSSAFSARRPAKPRKRERPRIACRRRGDRDSMCRCTPSGWKRSTYASVETTRSFGGRRSRSLAGVCNTDLEMVRGYYPFTGVPGHEFVGVVERADDAPEWVGRRVAGEINAVCGTCARLPGRTQEPLRAPDRARAHRTERDVRGEAVAADREPARDSGSRPRRGRRLHGAAGGRAARARPRAPAGPRPRRRGREARAPGARSRSRRPDCDLRVATRVPRERPILAAKGIATIASDDVTEASADVVVECTGQAGGLAVARKAVRPAGTIVMKSTYRGETAFDFTRMVVDEVTIVGSRCGPFEPAIRALADGQHRSDAPHRGALPARGRAGRPGKGRGTGRPEGPDRALKRNRPGRGGTGARTACPLCKPFPREQKAAMISPERWHQIDALFDEALDVEPEARAAFLDDRCPPELRASVDALLRGSSQSEQASRPARGCAARSRRRCWASWTAASRSRAGPSAAGRIDDCQLIRLLGEGGMGEVWEAEQTGPVRRRVALKVVKAGMDTKRVTARFDSERQALALMNHPNVAQVFGGGTAPSGRPYFVMELVPRREPAPVLPRPRPRRAGAAAPLPPGLRGRAARAPQGPGAPRPQALEHPGDRAGRPAAAEDHRLRRRARARRAARAGHDAHRAGPDRRHARVHEPGAGRLRRARRGHALRRLLAGRHPVRAAHGRAALHRRGAARTRLRRAAAEHPRDGPAAAQPARATPRAAARCAATSTGSS